MKTFVFVSLAFAILFFALESVPGHATTFTQLTFRPAASDLDPAWSPDATTIVFCSDSPSWSIWRIPVSGGSATYLFPGADPCWSPDGSKIAFTSLGGEICVAPANGGAITQLTFMMPTRSQGNPAWSPDGSTIAFSSDDLSYRPTPAPQIWTVPTTGGTPTRLIYQLFQQPCWSPDGSHLTFSSGYVGLASFIFVGRSDGSEVIQITSCPPSNNSYDSGPAWSPDGRWIAFHSAGRSSKGADCDIWFVSPSGGTPIPVTQEGDAFTCAGAPSWSPDSRSIAFSANWSGDSEIWLASELPGTPTSVNETTWGRIKVLFK
jgi:Tol biopolymer transport system component